MSIDDPQKHPFTWDHYRVILEAALRAGYQFLPFTKQLRTGERFIFLRHDIDNDVNIAYEMAKLEAELGICSTYLVMLRSANYNPAEGRCVDLFEKMAMMGHEIGLHFSLADYPTGRQSGSLERLIREDVLILERIMGRPIKVFGFHNPEDRSQFQIEIPGLINTYAKRTFDDLCYLSESNMRWRHGCPCQLLTSAPYPAIQLLVHPLSYADNLTTDREVILHYLLIKLQDLLDYNVAQNRILRNEDVSLNDFAHLLSSKRKSNG